MRRALIDIFLAGLLIHFGSAAAGSPGTELPLSLALSQQRLQSSVRELLAGQSLGGTASGRYAGDKVVYSVAWSADARRAGLRLLSLKNGRVRASLRLPLRLAPSFKLRNGAERVYSKEGCGAVGATALVTLDLGLTKGVLGVASPVTGVSIPKNYICRFKRNVWGDIGSWVSSELSRSLVNVVPLIRSGIKRHLTAVSAPVQQLVSGLLGGPALAARLKKQLADPIRVADNVTILAAFHELLGDRLTLEKSRLVLQARVRLQPRFRFGALAGAEWPVPAEATVFSEGFRLDFELLIPRSLAEPAVTRVPVTGQPLKNYRFNRLAQHPRVVVLQRYQGDTSEDVVWLQAGVELPPAADRVSMGEPISGILDEIVAWLADNRGVRSAGSARVDQLRREVLRFAKLVDHFQRPRDLPLAAVGTLQLSNLNADLQWLSLESGAIRAGVLLSGQAKLRVEL